MYECSFNDGQECRDVLEVVDPFSSQAAQLRWTRNRGSTPTINTGPNVDRTGNSEHPPPV